MSVLVNLLGRCGMLLEDADHFDLRNAVRNIYSEVCGFLPKAKTGLKLIQIGSAERQRYSIEDAIRDIHILRGKITLEIERREYQLELARLHAAGRGVFVTATSSNDNRVTSEATSNAAATADTPIEIVSNLITSSSLETADRELLQDTIGAMGALTLRHDEKGFAHKLAEALSIAEKASGLIPQIAKAAALFVGMN